MKRGGSVELPLSTAVALTHSPDFGHVNAGATVTYRHAGGSDKIDGFSMMAPQDGLIVVLVTVR